MGELAVARDLCHQTGFYTLSKHITLNFGYMLSLTYYKKIQFHLTRQQ